MPSIIFRPAGAAVASVCICVNLWPNLFNCFSLTTLTCPADILSRSRERGTLRLGVLAVKKLPFSRFPGGWTGFPVAEHHSRSFCIGSRSLDAFPAGSDAIPARLAGVPGQITQPPGSVFAVPGRPDGFPGWSDSVPTWSDGLPSSPDAVPAGLDAVPGQNDRLSRLADAVPAWPDAVPAPAGTFPGRICGNSRSAIPAPASPAAASGCSTGLPARNDCRPAPDGDAQKLAPVPPARFLIQTFQFALFV